MSTYFIATWKMCWPTLCSLVFTWNSKEFWPLPASYPHLTQTGLFIDSFYMEFKGDWNRQVKFNSVVPYHTVFQRMLWEYYVVSYVINCVKTFWTYHKSLHSLHMVGLCAALSCIIYESAFTSNPARDKIPIIPQKCMTWWWKAHIKDTG